MSQNQPAIDEIYLAALAQEIPEQRAAFLDEACGANCELRQRVERLLEAQLKACEFLEQPAADVLATEIRPLTEQPGDTIGPYKILQQIGEGGMGTVFMAEQTEPVERRVALKIIKPGMDTQKVIARFEAERQALAMMDHPNIAKVLDAGTTDTGRPFFVMELVKGVPITDYCDEQHLTPKERLELFIPICQAVQHAHQKGIIHRDLKPSNILVAQYDGKPVPKVIDFGVAKTISQKLTEKTMFTQYGQIVGTVDYMSPEQAQFNQLDVDTRSDVYSLGVVLYELLTGETPFDRARLRSAAFDEMLRIIREEEPSKPSTKVSSSLSLPSIAANRRIEPAKLGSMIRGELDWIVLKAMEKDRGRRYETASAFAADVQHYLNDEAVVACPPSSLYRLKKFARRNKTVIATTAVIAVSLIVGASVAVWQAIEASRERDRALLAEKLADNRLHTVESQRNEIAEEKKRADSEADKARTTAAIAESVNAFLCDDLLGMTDSESQADDRFVPNPQITLRAVLDRAAKKIEGEFPDQPLVKAAIQDTIGRTYLSLGELREAEEHLQKAMELRRRNLGPDAPLTANSLNNVALVYFDQARYDDAEQLMKEALEIYHHTLGDEHKQALNCRNNLGLVYMAQLRYDEAEEVHKDTLEIRRRTLGEEHPSTISSMSNLASVYTRQHKYDAAEQLNQRALEIYRRTLGDNHPAALRTQHNLAIVYQEQDRYADAERLSRATLSVLQSVLGSNHPDTLFTMAGLADTLIKQGRLGEAETIYREVLEACRRTVGDDHPLTLKAKGKLAALLRDSGSYRDAIEAFQEVVEAERRTLGPGHPTTVGSQRDLAATFERSGDLNSAVAIYRDLLENAPDDVLSLRGLGYAQQRMGDRKAAAMTYRRAIELDKNDKWTWIALVKVTLDIGGHEAIVDAFSGIIEDGVVNHHVFRARGWAFGELGRFPEAISDLRNAVALCRTDLSKSPSSFESRWALAGTLWDLGQVLRKDSRPAEAEMVLRDAVELMLDVAGEVPGKALFQQDANNLLRDLSAALREQAKHLEAAAVSQRAYERQLKLVGDYPANLWYQRQMLWTAQAHADCLELSGRWEEAVRMRRYAVQVNVDLMGQPPGKLEYRKRLATGYLKLAATLHDAGHPEEIEQPLREAVFVQEKLVEEFPGNGQYRETLGRCLKELGIALESGEKYAEALTCLERAAEVAPDNPWFHHALACFRLYTTDVSFHDLDQAARHATRAVELNPGEPQHHRQLAEARFRLKDWPRTVESLEKAISLGSPVDIASCFELAICYGQLAEKEKANEWRSKALALWEDHTAGDPALRDLRKEAEEVLETTIRETANN